MFSLHSITTFARRSFLVTALTAAAAIPALAGPPLICHPFDIGTARSLPFGDTQNGWSGWQATLSTYDRSKLVDDTLALLTPKTPVIVRMETLRRASAYSVDDKALANGLLAALEARTTKTPKTPAEGLASFDYGYLVETYRQLGQRGVAVKATVDTVDGYSFVKTALAQMPDDAGLQFAAALITEGPSTRAQHTAHLQKAKEMAKADALVARNVATHFAN
jgi:hypothetical protein